MAEGGTRTELPWDEEAPLPDPAFRRQLWTAFGVFAVLLVLCVSVLTYVYLRAVQDKALSVALEKGQASADELGEVLERLAEVRQSDLYTVVRDRREMDEVIGGHVGSRQIVDSWQILDAEGGRLAESTRLTSGRGAKGSPGDPPIATKQFLTVDREILLEGKKAGLLRLFLSEPDLMREVEEFQRDVRMKAMGAAALTLLLLLSGFAYVIALLSRTQRIHDQAEARLRLASLGALAGGLAHEIRNPLNAMNMNVQLLEEDIAASGLAPDPSWRQTLQSTRQEIKRLDELVTNVLTYARPLQLQAEPLRLAELSADLVAFLRPELARAKVEVSLEVPPDVAVSADPARLRQALLNVMRNAMQAIATGNGAGGHIRLSCRRDGAVVHLDVQDDGPGLDADVRRGLFEAFGSTKPGGTGLGLPIARKILRAHGGELRLADAAPRGTRVTFTLPA